MIVDVRGVKIGKGERISIQSMCTTATTDIEATVTQINALKDAGCDIVRLAVPDMASAQALASIRKCCDIPLVADIHYDYRLAIASAPHVDKLRINPGNLKGKIKEVVTSAIHHGIPIRVGVNLGSLDKDIERKMGRTADAMVASAEQQVSILESYGFKEIVVSLKSSDIKTTITACRLFRKNHPHPLHIGITESGTELSGSIKSAIGIGILLHEGIGDTIRVSLSGDPVREVIAAKLILKHLGLRKGLTVNACPTCARTGFDVASTASLIEAALGHLDIDKTVAVMGCEVNGPGEAKGADVAIVGCGTKQPLLYVNGKYKRTLDPSEIVNAVSEELR